MVESRTAAVEKWQGNADGKESKGELEKRTVVE
jgi:hypothetical protein